MPNVFPDDILARIRALQVQLDALTVAALGSPLTTKGDVWGYDTADSRVPVGTDGDVLTADSGDAQGVSWQAPAGGASLPISDSVTLTDATTFDVVLDEPTETATNYVEWFAVTGANSAQATRTAQLKLIDDNSGSPNVSAMIDATSEAFDEAYVRAGVTSTDPYLSFYVNEGGGSATLEGEFFSHASGSECGLSLNSVSSGAGPYLQMSECVAAPAAAPTNFGRLFMRDNGFGKTQLVVRFHTGAVQVIATEP